MIVSRGQQMVGCGVGFGGNLSPENLSAIVPAIDCTAPASTVGPKYGFVSTRAAIDGLAREGWQVVGAGTAKTRDPLRRVYAQHLVRLRHPDIAPMRGEGVPELLVRNGHAGNSSFQVMAGFFRTICANGLVVNSVSIGSFRVFHRAADVVGVVEAGTKVATALPDVVRRIEDWRQVRLDGDKAIDFAERATALRWSAEAPIDPLGLLAPRRAEDQGDDLWRILNRVQEGLLRGAEPTPGWQRPQTPSGRPRAIRPVRSVVEQTRINAALWALAEEVSA